MAAEFVCSTIKSFTTRDGSVVLEFDAVTVVLSPYAAADLEDKLVALMKLCADPDRKG